MNILRIILKGGIKEMVNVFNLDFAYEEVNPMKIERITVHGFRNIKNTSLRFNNILALVSLNSYGKSNLLKAIEFGMDFITVDNKKMMMRWIPGVPLNKKLAKEDFKFELEMTAETNMGKVRATYGYQFRWVKDDEKGSQILGEWLKVKKEEKGQKYSKYIIRENGQAKFKRAESGRCDHSIKIEPNELVINKLQAYDNLFFLEIVKKINKISVHIERHLDADTAYRSDPFIRTDLEVLQIDNIDNLPRAIYNLKHAAFDKYELLVNSYRQLFPQIEKIEVAQATFNGDIDFEIPDNVPLKITNEVFVLRVTDKNLNQPINFKSMSDGAKRILLLLTCILLSDYNKLSLVAIEEPDNCIHPSLLRNLLIILSQMAGDCRVLVTSHSPYLIQFIDPSNLYIGVPSNNGVAHFDTIRSSYEKTLMKDASEAKLTIGDYIFDLMSGSEDDINELNQYMGYDEE